MSHPAQVFVEAHVEQVKSLSRDLSLAHWESAISGSEEASKRRAQLDAQLTRIYANTEEFERLRVVLEEASGADGLETHVQGIVTEEREVGDTKELVLSIEDEHVCFSVPRDAAVKPGEKVTLRVRLEA